MTKAVQFKQVISILILVVFILLTLTTFVYADEKEIYTEGLFRYTIKDNKITIVDYGYNWDEENYDNILSRIYNSRDTESNKLPLVDRVVIPDKINGMKVVDVSDDVFGPLGWSFYIKELVCSDYMVNIKMRKFDSEYIESIVLGKYTKRFEVKSYPHHDQSPLKKIFVPKNAKYLKVAKNGALYSKNGKVLYAVPTCKTGNLKVSAKTRKIYKYAFADCNLKKVVLPAKLKVKNVSKYAFSEFGYKYDDNNSIIKVPKKKLVAFKKRIHTEAKVVGY